jgi:energy-coupling factor transport system permease protein
MVAALQTSFRVVAFAIAVGLLALTTAVPDLLDDLERRGVGRRLIFVTGSAVQTIPRMLERAGEIVDAQRARGLDTEGSPWRRVRGVVPLAGPMVLSALSEVEERTMALEARAFSAPGRRTTLRPMRDRGWERALRWALGIGSIVLVVLSLTGRLPLP